MTIRILDPKTIARIAAGEVVERPASVVKELVENSLDAGATQITVEAQGGGVALLRVTDNGKGIASSEVEIAFQRHATSKLQKLEDLEAIATLGFRGEALPSIAAVAEVELTTAVAGQAGDYLHLQDGAVVRHTPQARPPGTTITVKNLFRQVPARLKFLKAAATENSHIAGVVTQYALAYPEVKFTLQSKGKTVLQTPGDGNLLATLMAVYGLETAKNMAPVRHADSVWQEGSVSDIQVSGLVSSPVISRAGRDALHFYVNRRAINSRVLTFATEEAYTGLLMTGRHPVAVINLTLPPAQVDVNIHPTKSEVKFQDERAVFTAVQRAVRAALVQLAPVPQIDEVNKTYRAQPPAAGQAILNLPENKAGVDTLAIPVVGQQKLPPLRVLGQVAGNYLLAEGPDGLYIIDQHAAAERLGYEKIKKQWESHRVEQQGLLTPAVLAVTPAQDAALQSGSRELADFGFELTPFGERSYLVRTVPAILAKGDWLAAIKEILDEPAAGAARIEAMLKSLACHSVVRAGQTLADEEMRALVRQLEAAAQPFTCPHGRPTLIHLTTAQLEKEFGRT